MPFSYLLPIEEDIIFNEYSSERLGGIIQKYTQEEGFPDLNSVQLAIILVSDENEETLPNFRKHFYNLCIGNWDGLRIADLGNLFVSHFMENTHLVLQELVEKLLRYQISPIIIGSNQELTYSLYRAFNSLEQQVNLVCVDAFLDFGNKENSLLPYSYLSKILTEPPNLLNNFINIGYQTYYNSQEVLDMISHMQFEAHRLGEVTRDLAQVEPLLRNADIVSLDMTSVEGIALDWAEGLPNGFTNREICSVARHSGSSMQTSVFGVFETPNTPRALQLLTQVIWYFIDGFYHRVKEFPSIYDENFTKYNVFIDEMSICFYKSNYTGRWWILPLPDIKDCPMLPASEMDYIEARNGTIPKRWWNIYRRNF